jgi:hypothetical protein
MGSICWIIGWVRLYIQNQTNPLDGRYDMTTTVKNSPLKLLINIRIPKMTLFQWIWDLCRTIRDRFVEELEGKEIVSKTKGMEEIEEEKRSNVQRVANVHFQKKPNCLKWYLIDQYARCKLCRWTRYRFFKELDWWEIDLKITAIEAVQDEKQKREWMVAHC